MLSKVDTLNDYVVRLGAEYSKTFAVYMDRDFFPMSSPSTTTTAFT